MKNVKIRPHGTHIVDDNAYFQGCDCRSYPISVGVAIVVTKVDLHNLDLDPELGLDIGFDGPEFDLTSADENEVDASLCKGSGVAKTNAVSGTSYHAPTVSAKLILYQILVNVQKIRSMYYLVLTTVRRRHTVSSNPKACRKSFCKRNEALLKVLWYSKIGLSNKT